jgi:hypothetical protein
MRYLRSVLLLAGVALAAPYWALGAQGPGTPLTMKEWKECMTRQAQMHDGASWVEMRKACSGSSDSANAESALQSSKPRAADAYPYGVLPNTVMSPPAQPN